MASRLVLIAIFSCAAFAFLANGCDQLDLKHRIMMCERMHDYRLQLIVESNSKDKNSAICCAGFQFIDCVMEIVDSNCTESVKDIVSLDVLFVNNTFCQNFVRDNCVKPHCHQDEYKHLGVYCHELYNEKIIHILEDPEIINKSAALCCALATNGRCLLDAMVDSECEGLPLNMKQSQGLTETYGHCDLYSYLDCSGSGSLVTSSATAVFLLFVLFLTNTRS